ncbi:segregation/condensation protein A [Candidatus Nomurabacteria bacterium]|nr:segregation/condensation protein A [Candidatus Nomurabacteria bacterium]
MQDTSTQPHPLVSVGEFEGPIEVLLNMIQDRKMPINDVSLAEVTDEYVAYIKNNRQHDYSYITHFLYVASTLLLIKSRSLLPSLELTDEEEESIDALQRRLKLYQIFRDQAEQIKPLFGTPSMFTRPFKMRRITVFSPDAAAMQPGNFVSAILGLDDIHEEEQQILPEVRVRTASVHINDMVENLKERMTKAMNISFKEFAKAPLTDATPREQKVYSIVGFLAMLEMVRNSVIAVEQNTLFDDIIINAS